MTRQEKIDWLKAATPEKLIEQLRWTVTAMTSGSIAQQIEANEDYRLVTEEMLKRMK